jgi:2'-5' RNA ligase
VKGVRSFVAVDLSPDALVTLLDASSEIRRIAPGWAREKWVAPENLHLTLQFLGDLEPGAVQALTAALSTAVAGHRAFSLRVAGLAAVPSRRRASIVWADLADEPTGACAALASAVSETAADFGVICEDRPFKPHVTLVRARRARSLPAEALTSADALVKNASVSMSVPFATLYASTLTPTGPVYECVARWDLLPGEERA